MARVFERGLTKPDRLRAAGAALEQSQRRSGRAGAPRSGRPAAASCSWCRAIRRSATACRSARCPTSRPTDYPHIVPLDPMRAARPPARPGQPAFHDSVPQQMAGSGRRARAGRRLVHRRRHRAARTASSRSSDEIDGTVRTAHHRRGARRAALRLHAAGRDGRGLSRTDRRGRAGRPRNRPARPDRGLRAAARPAPQRHPRRARSRRHRGQHPSRRELARIASRPPPPSTRRRGSRRLGADKFMIDGRHTGTGGGNHVVVGGATPADSPFLRRPDLLKSLVLLLAAPPGAVLPLLRPVHRPDQPGAAHRRGPPRSASTNWRSRSAQVPLPGEGAPPLPWLVDRLFRNLLVDVTGNTHRSEICIDKLYSPDGRHRPARAGRVPRLRDAARARA